MAEMITLMDNKIIMKEEIQYFARPAFPHPLRLHIAGISWCDGTYWIKRNRDNPVFVFEYVESGSGVLEVDGCFFHPRASDIYVAPGWKHHEYRSSAVDPWKKHWFNISGPLVEELVSLYGLSGFWHFPQSPGTGALIVDTVTGLKGMDTEKAHEWMALRLHRILQELSGRADVLRRKETSSADSAGLAFPAVSASAAAVSPELRRMAAQLRSFLLERVMGRKMPSLEEMARHISRSPVQTIRIFRSVFGVTPYAFLLDQKINAAAELLRGSGCSIKEIASLLGFDDEYYFARIFKKRKKLPPGAYRARRS